jgi:DNA-binding transcriptional regulator YiaG
VAKGLHSHRARLGLSAKDYGRLAGVSAQTIYSWERRKSVPRAQQRASLAAVRGLGKREARTRLEALSSRAGKRTSTARR